MKKHEMCPVCKIVALKPTYYKKVNNGKLQWLTKDLLVCPTEICTVIATHTNNRILYLTPHPEVSKKPNASNASIRLRLGLPMINLLSKQDLITDMVGEIIKWSSNLSALENAIASSTDGESYALISNILRGLNQGGFSQGLIPISSVTGEGMVNLEMALSRIINQGEEIED